MTSRNSHGKTFILATAGVAVLAWAGITFLPTDRVDAKVDKPQHSSGTLACGGFYTTNNKQKLRWIFRNHNDVPISIDRFVVYDWDGTLLWDSTDTTGGYGGYLPTDRNGLVSETDKVLEPHATAWYRSEDLQPEVLPQHPADPTYPNNFRNAVILHVEWSAASNVDALAGTLVRHVYMGDPAAPTPWGRSTSACRDI